MQTRKCDATPCFGSSSRSGKISCARCQKAFHLKCAGLTTNQLKFVRDCPGIVWLCLICRNTPDVDQSATSVSFGLILDRITSVIRLVGHQIEVTKSLCRAFGHESSRPRDSSVLLNHDNTHTDDGRNFVEELDNLQLDLSNEFNTLVDVGDKDIASNHQCSSSPEVHTETASPTSREVGQAGVVFTTVAEVHTVPASLDPPSSSTTSRVPDNQASASRTIACPGKVNQDICPSEASSGTASSSNSIQPVADYAQCFTSSGVQSKTDAATQSHQPVRRQGGPAIIPPVSTHRPQVLGTSRSTRDVATQSTQHASNVKTSQRSKKHRKQSFQPSYEPTTTAPMPYWYLPTPASSSAYSSYANPHVSHPMWLPPYNVSAPVAVPVNGPSSTPMGELPTLPRLLPSSKSSYTATLHPPTSANFSRKVVVPVNSSGFNESAEKFKPFYITPFAPSTTVEQISSYIRNKTGWTKASFRCQSLTSAASRRRPPSFISFKVSTLDNPAFTNIITKDGFWPSFVNVTPFEPKARK